MEENIEFNALIVREQGDGSFVKAIEKKRISQLPEGEVIIQVMYAGLNYKDALSASGHKGISRRFPHTPGVDASGVVVASKDASFAKGDEVIVTGYDLGMNTSGGFQEFIRVPAGWVVPKPAELSLKEAMVLGTAGFTAALSLYKMELMGQQPSLGEILVTGASGGVGSMAVGILAKAGYEVIASTGSESAHDHLKKLGAQRIEPRSIANDESGRPLLRSQWAGAIDTVGGNTLATCVKACARRGSVASCGLVASHELNMTVYPFLLNGVNILGVDSAETAMSLRRKLWDKLCNDWRIADLVGYGHFVGLDEIPTFMEQMLQGKTTGRVVACM